MPRFRQGTSRVAFAAAFAAILSFTPSLPAFAQPAREPAALTVGSPAPTLDVTEWIRGSSPVQLKPGRVHVVTFFATWCPASRRALPLLSALSDRFKDKATFLAVASRDGNGQSRAALDAYLRSAPGAITFPVASDDRRYAWTAWMDAAEKPWLPTTFIINANGTVGWIGNPLWIPGEVEDAITRAVAGTLDPASSSGMHRSWLTRRERTAQLEEEVLQAHANNRHDIALKTLDRLIEYSPAGEPGYVIWKIEILLSFAADPAAAIAEGKRAIAGPIARDPEALAQLGAALFEAEGLPNRDLELADTALRRALEIGGALSNDTLSTAAQVARERRQIPRAIELITLAMSNSRDAYEKQAFEQTLKDLQAELNAQPAP